MLALALVIAIGSLVLPAIDAGPATWREATRAVSLATIEARALAMHTGRPTQLVAHTGPAGIELRAGAMRPATEGTESAGPPPTSGDTLGALPSGATIEAVSIGDEAPEADVEHAPAEVATASAAGAANAPAGRPPARDIVLVTILPGGQVAMAPGWQLVAGDRHAAPTLNTWTGEVSFAEPSPAPGALASDAKQPVAHEAAPEAGGDQ